MQTIFLEFLFLLICSRVCRIISFSSTRFTKPGFISTSSVHSIHGLSHSLISSQRQSYHYVVQRQQRRSHSLRAKDDSTAAISSLADGSMSADLKNSIAATLKWVGAAAAFGAGIAMYKGVPSAVEYCSGYVLEQCLSVDNLFVFLVLFEYFNLDRKQQEHVLNYGIWGAIVLRGIFIGLGTVALSSFHQILLVFAGILLFSSYKILFDDDGDEDEDPSDNPIVNFASSLFPATNNMDGINFFTMEEGVRKATPLLICLFCIEFSDVVFALDSVPAVFGVTEDPLIVFSSNIFAIAGLRSLYNVLSKAVEELQYLEKAVGVILAIIATKMGLETFGINILTPLQTLLVVLGLLGGGVGLSIFNSETEDEEDDASS